MGFAIILHVLFIGFGLLNICHSIPLNFFVMHQKIEYLSFYNQKQKIIITYIPFSLLPILKNKF
jgi:hypothetical protein